MCERRFGSILSQIPLLMCLLTVAALAPSVHAAESSVATVNCGQFLEREFHQVGQIHDYQVWMEPGETMILRVTPIGGTLSVTTSVYEPASQVAKESGDQNEVRLTTSARGLHTVRVINARTGDGSGRVGVYTLGISCQRSDGSYVEPGAQGRGPAPVPGGEATASALQAASALTDAAAGLQTMGNNADDIQKLQKLQKLEKIQNLALLATGPVGGVVGAVGIAKDLWSAFRKRKAMKGEAQVVAPNTDAPPSPVDQRPEDLVAQGGQPVYAAPVESLAPSNPRSPIPGAIPPSQPAAVVDRRTFPLLGLGTVLQGEISASTGAQGCRFEAKAGQGVDLKFERLTGDQGLVVTVFGPDQQPVFLTSVLASPKIATRLQLPAAGEYAVEVAAAGPAGGSPARFSLQLAAASK